MTKTTVRNITPGIRGLNTEQGYRDLMPGETVDVELSDGERKNADSTGYFEFGSKAKAAAAPAGDDATALPRNAPKLKAIAKSEGIDVGDATKVDDLVAAIEAGRAAKAAGGIPATTATTTDDWDNADDDLLRSTAAALEGKPEADYAETSRDDLLAIVRKPAAE